MNTEDIREGGVYRAMEGDWTVKRIENGRVQFVLVDAEACVGNLALDHFAHIAVGEVRQPDSPIEESQ